jgi:hypothetical protein
MNPMAVRTFQQFKKVGVYDANGSSYDPSNKDIPESGVKLDKKHFTSSLKKSISIAFIAIMRSLTLLKKTRCPSKSWSNEESHKRINLK